MASDPAAGWARVEYTRVTELHGPIMVVPHVRRVGWDEFARIRLTSGERRHGLVLEVDRDRAVVQVLEGTEGMRPDGVSVAFTGEPLHVPVGAGWLGRVCDGLGGSARRRTADPGGFDRAGEWASDEPDTP